MVGAACGASSQARAGLLAFVGDHWHAVGPHLAGVPAGARTSVLRLALAGTQVSALVAAGTAHGESLVAMWQSANGGPWTQSSALPVPNATVLSTAIGVEGEVLTLLDAPGAHSSLVEAHSPTGSWTRLPSPPPGTSTVAEAADGSVDGFVVRHSRLTVFRLGPGATRWERVEQLTVPISYGSSG
jgi:hypothetical protein